MRTFLRRKGIDPDKDLMLRAIGGSNLRVSALEKGIVAAAPFAPDDTVRLTRVGFPMIANLSDTPTIPQTILVARNEISREKPGNRKEFPEGAHPWDSIR